LQITDSDTDFVSESSPSDLSVEDTSEL